MPVPRVPPLLPRVPASSCCVSLRGPPFRGQKSKEQHPCRGSPTRIFLCPSLPVTHVSPFFFFYFLVPSHGFHLPRRVRSSGVASIVHRAAGICTRERDRGRRHGFYGDIIRSALFANRPPGQTSSLVRIIDSLNRARGSDGHLLTTINALIARPLGRLTSARGRFRLPTSPPLASQIALGPLADQSSSAVLFILNRCSSHLDTIIYEIYYIYGIYEIYESYEIYEIFEFHEIYKLYEFY